MDAHNAVGLFLDSVERFPDRPALWVDGRVWSYAELHAQAERLADRLRAHAGPVCATLGDRSLIAYCAPLACMLAGRIHVPLGVSFPEERMAGILRRTRPSVLICDLGGSAMLPGLLAKLDFAPAVVSLDPEFDAIAPRADAAAADIETPVDASPDAKLDASASGLEVEDRDIAYVLFTSGSTGVPKGVAVGHRALRAYVDAVRALYPELDEHQRCSQFFEPTFDLSMHDMFVTWAVGACLYGVPRSALMMPTDFVNEHRLTVWFSVPSLLAALNRFRQLRPGTFPSLRLSLFCGEALPGPLAGAWLEAAPNARCDNIYGPTEATIACTAHRVSQADAARKVVPIGTAFPAMEIAVVDAEGAPCAQGETGELWLGGAQLAFGYWRDREQTAARFVERTLPGLRSPRWYRTGDLAALEADGTALFLGRADRQIKLRGYRIELQDVEAHLREVCAGPDSAAEVAVVPIVPPGGDAPAGLAAFVVCAHYDARQAMAAMKARLPHYMVPSEVHVLDKLPLNSNGKVDYPALAAAQRARAAAPERPNRTIAAPARENG
ncbi:MAG: D-alanine--poly(phosphoribitol) ligase [Lysobacter sp.]|nr:MAG: D-alanine--poly(phosphoribitol) ligase [Lysobacter sp.]